jgi:hypothetical protein
MLKNIVLLFMGKGKQLGKITELKILSEAFIATTAETTNQMWRERVTIAEDRIPPACFLVAIRLEIRPFKQRFDHELLPLSYSVASNIPGFDQPTDVDLGEPYHCVIPPGTDEKDLKSAATTLIGKFYDHLKHLSSQAQKHLELYYVDTLRELREAKTNYDNALAKIKELKVEKSDQDMESFAVESCPGEIEKELTKEKKHVDSEEKSL